MEWINIHRSTLEKEEMLAAEPAHVCTWLLLQAYCHGQENGGRIVGARKWTARTWLRAAMLEQTEVLQESGLWHWDEQDLVVEFYPVEKEKLVATRRRAAAKGGRASGQARSKAQAEASVKAHVEAPARASVAPQAEASVKGVVERKGMEGKGMEEKGREEGSLEVGIPSLEEVRDWADGSVGVDPDYAEAKWNDTNEKHAWIANGKLIDWKARWKRFWEEDRDRWISKKKNRAAAQGGETGGARGEGRREGDADWWWSEPVEVVERALTGALLAGDPMAERLREIVAARKNSR